MSSQAAGRVHWRWGPGSLSSYTHVRRSVEHPRDGRGPRTCPTPHACARAWGARYLAEGPKASGAGKGLAFPLTRSANSLRSEGPHCPRCAHAEPLTARRLPPLVQARPLLDLSRPSRRDPDRLKGRPPPHRIPSVDLPSDKIPVPRRGTLVPSPAQVLWRQRFPGLEAQAASRRPVFSGPVPTVLTGGSDYRDTGLLAPP